MIWVLVGYMWLFIHRPFEIWPIFATIHLERSYMIFTLIAWFAISAKTWTANRVQFGLIFVASSILISATLSPYTTPFESITVDKWFKVFIFFLLIMTSVRDEKDMKILVTAFIVCSTLYFLHSYREYLCGKGTWRMGTWRMVGVAGADPNSFGNGINYAMCMLLPFMALIKEQKKKRTRQLMWLFLIGSFCLCVLCIQLTGSRSSFMVLVISLFGLAMLSKYRVRIILALVIAVPLVWITLPQNLKDRYETIWNPEAGPANAQASAEGRWDGFYGGIEVWQNNLPFGVGPGCYAVASGSGFQTHNLIGQVLSELGTLGAISYLALIGMVMWNQIEAHSLYKTMKDNYKEAEVLYLYRVSFAVVWAVVLLIILGFGGHNAFRYTWVWYAAFQGIAVSLMRKKVEDSTAVNFQRKSMRRFGTQPKAA